MKHQDCGHSRVPQVSHVIGHRARARILRPNKPKQDQNHSVAQTILWGPPSTVVVQRRPARKTLRREKHSLLAHLGLTSLASEGQACKCQPPKLADIPRPSRINQHFLKAGAALRWRQTQVVGLHRVSKNRQGEPASRPECGRSVGLGSSWNEGWNMEYAPFRATSVPMPVPVQIRAHRSLPVSDDSTGKAKSAPAALVDSPDHI